MKPLDEYRAFTLLFFGLPLVLHGSAIDGEAGFLLFASTVIIVGAAMLSFGGSMLFVVAYIWLGGNIAALLASREK